MRSIIEFVHAWYSDAAGALRRADPLLMGAAFAYNSLFAVVPLALAFVSVLTLLDTTQKVLGDAEEFINEALPADIADFLNQILRESVEVVASNRLVIIVVTLLVALWSGSRAVYTVQKALRLVEDSEVEVGYVHMRVTGILVTVGGGVGVVAAYALLVLGRGLTGRLASLLPWGLPLGQFLLAGVAALWIFVLLFAVYRWGAPQPIRRPAATSALVTTVLFVGTWVGFSLVPSETAVAVAVFGTIGLVLLWLYGIGVVVVAGPIAVGSLLRVLEERTHR
ncbi:MAG: YihY/virulence factor BrkB family protein [Acidimicrobiia bacterium]